MRERYRILITTDSISDLPEELVQKLPVAILPSYVVTEQGRFIDGKETNTKELLRFMKKEENIANSAMPGWEDYHKFFREKLLFAERIIHISMGKNVSPGYAHACKAAKKLQGVTVFDSGQVSSGVGLVVRKAAMLVEQGSDYEEICTELKKYAKAVSSGFVSKSMSFMYRSQRISHMTKDICDRLLLHPRFQMKKSRLRVKGIHAGRWENVIHSYIKRQLGLSWKIDTEILVITYVGVSDERLEIIKEEVMKYVRFEKIYLVEASSAIACNCGKNTFGLSFAKKRKKEREKGASTSFREKFLEKKEFLTQLLANEKFPIRQRIMNLIFFAALFGGTLSGIVNIVMSAYESALVIFIMMFVIFGCLYLSIVRKRWKEAGLIACLLANMIVFPLMFFSAGGIRSGMSVWFVMGLLFDWMILTGWLSYFMFGINLAVVIGCILIGEMHPEFVVPVTQEYFRTDVIQSVFFVVLILGSIYKYQAYVYEKQRKKLQEHEEELLRSNSAKDLFLANMSHEIRTPINGIMGMNTMLLRECGDNEELKEYGRNIQSSSQTLLSLVNDILDVSKIEAGKFEINSVEYDIFSVVNDCYQIAHSRSMAKGLEFEIAFNPAIPCRLYGDEVRIRQVVNNLLSNAVKYTEKGTVRLSIDIGKKSDAAVDLMISVHDTGIGIRKEDQENIFKSFLRVDERRNRNIEGTGLGLNLTKNLVELMRGDIRVESTYGQGSVFIVRLPQQIRDRRPAGDFAKKYQESLDKQLEEVEPVYTRDAAALVVDDVPMNLLVAKGILKYTGMEIDTADSGREALSMVCRKKYDIIFMDHVMPEMDGIACLHQMKELKNNQNMDTPVIALTANAISGIREEYIRTGFQDYLSKPIAEKEIYAILETYLPQEKIVEKGQPEEFREKEVPAGRPEQIKTGITKKRGLCLDNLEQIPGLDAETGLNFCLNKEDFYFNVIREYLKGEKSAVLNEALEKEDWEQYRIHVHTLKSTSMNIGAKDLSEEARISEMACKEGDFKAVRERHEKLMEQYHALYGALEVLAKEE
ncbi:MAG: DegV family EDD domain-containing protein [Lachnospiraceae bacterium]|nr:DegV family EDD domain-containing protein [Lachnospiraceae bacterium]